MAHVKKGSKVQVHYRGMLKDGTVFETNYGKPPLEFKVGAGKVISGFEKAVIGMNLGQVKTAVMKPGDAYGQKDPDLIWQLTVDQLPADVVPEIGREVDFTLADGTEVAGEIRALEADRVTVDGNHPLAGCSLTFEIKLVAVK